MSATQTDNGPVLGKWIVIMGAIIAAGLVVASIWALVRALSNFTVEPEGNSSLQNSATPAGAAAGASQEEIERQHEMAEQRTAPVIQAPVAAQSAVIPTKQDNDEVILQQAKTKVNQRIVDRMKQYVRDNPNRDNRDIQEQIKKRENQGAQTR